MHQSVVISIATILLSVTSTANAGCKLCGLHETRDDCYSPCNPEPTCLNPYPPLTEQPCKLKCIQKCVCKSGYIRSKTDGKCIRRANCGVCPTNEIRVSCVSTCYVEPTCKNPIPLQWTDECNLKCESKCLCKPGYIRSQLNGLCIKNENCPTVKCGKNQILGCKSCCDPLTCSTLKQVCTKFCPAICLEECICKPGYVLDSAGGNCIPIKSCPPY